MLPRFLREVLHRRHCCVAVNVNAALRCSVEDETQLTAEDLMGPMATTKAVETPAGTVHIAEMNAIAAIPVSDSEDAIVGRQYTTPWEEVPEGSEIMKIPQITRPTYRSYPAINADEAPEGYVWGPRPGFLEDTRADARGGTGGEDSP